VGSAVEVCEGADALAVLTEWPEFSGVDANVVAAVMKSLAVVDGRNVLNPEVWKSVGFAYRGVGRS
jgi:UDPglucose 6-dehydrogenase